MNLGPVFHGVAASIFGVAAQGANFDYNQTRIFRWTVIGVGQNPSRNPHLNNRIPGLKNSIHISMCVDVTVAVTSQVHHFRSISFRSASYSRCV